MSELYINVNSENSYINNWLKTIKAFLYIICSYHNY